MSDYIQQKSYPINYTSATWAILNPIEQSIKEKIEKYGTPLKDWNVTINYGIKTGCNDAFIVDEITRQELIAEDPKSAELIRPILRGRDIKRYGYDFAGLYLIATFPSKHYNIENYPAIKKWLQKFGKKLEQTGEEYIDENGKKQKCRKKTNNKWYETQDSIAYWNDFSQQKIIWKRVGSILRFCFDDNNCLCLDSTCFLSGENLLYLLAILNSRMGHYLLKDAPKTGTGDLLISVQAIEPLKIPLQKDVPNNIIQQIIELTKKIISGSYSQSIEKELDNLVCKLYNLSAEEIQYIMSFT